MTIFRRTLLTAAAFAAFLWAGIGILQVAGAKGLAGPVVQSNLNAAVDATGLFYTELDPAVFGRARR